MSDDYVTVVAKMRARTAKAVLLDVGKDVGRGAWIPRSCINGVDERTLDGAVIDSEVTLRIVEWIAEREGLI